jgi:hypothetical protein
VEFLCMLYILQCSESPREDSEELLRLVYRLVRWGGPSTMLVTTLDWPQEAHFSLAVSQRQPGGDWGCQNLPHRVWL